MLRAVSVVLACVCLGGCWTSEADLFTPADLSPLAISGEYVARSLDADPNPITVTAQPGRLLAMRYRDPDSGETKTERWDFVKVPGVAANYYLAFQDAAKDSAAIELKKGHLYVLAKLDDDGNLLFYLPDCQGTKLTLSALDRGDGSECKFSSKAALLEAAKQAVAFIEGPSIVAVSPLGELSPKDKPKLKD